MTSRNQELFERAQRRILVNYPKRQVGNKMYGGESSHLPLKLNTSGRKWKCQFPALEKGRRRELG